MSAGKEETQHETRSLYTVVLQQFNHWSYNDLIM